MLNKLIRNLIIDVITIVVLVTIFAPSIAPQLKKFNRNSDMIIIERIIKNPEQLGNEIFNFIMGDINLGY